MRRTGYVVTRSQRTFGYFTGELATSLSTCPRKDLGNKSCRPPVSDLPWFWRLPMGWASSALATPWPPRPNLRANESAQRNRAPRRNFFTRPVQEPSGPNFSFADVAAQASAEVDVQGSGRVWEKTPDLKDVGFKVLSQTDGTASCCISFPSSELTTGSQLRFALETDRVQHIEPDHSSRMVRFADRRERDSG